MAKGWLADKKQPLLTPWKPRKKKKSTEVFSLGKPARKKPARKKKGKYFSF